MVRLTTMCGESQNHHTSEAPKAMLKWTKGAGIKKPA